MRSGRNGELNGSVDEKSSICMSTWVSLAVNCFVSPLEENSWAGVHLACFFRFWQLAVDALPPQDAKDLEEHLGIERDTPEHLTIEQGSLCQQPSNPLKRKRR
jgi:hypothetical protein